MQWRLNPDQSGGGLFNDLAPHQIDLMHYFFGSIASSGGMARNQAKAYGAADVVSGQIWFERGALFTGHWAFNVAEKCDVCEVIGSEGQISFSVFDYQPITLVSGPRLHHCEFYTLQPLKHTMIT